MFYPDLKSAADIFNAVEDLTNDNTRIFRRLGRPLDLLEYNVWYESALSGRNHYANAEDVIRRGVGVCHDFTAWMKAWFRWYGIPEETVLIQQTATLFHVILTVKIEGRGWVALDPSKMKGMPYYDTSFQSA